MYYIVPKQVSSGFTMEGAYRLAQRASQVFANVLIVGESGVGKEYLARQIHRCRDPEERGFKVYPCYSSEINFREIQQLLFLTPPRAVSQSPVTLFLKSVGGISEKAQLQLLEMLEGKRIAGLEERTEAAYRPRLISSSEQDFGKVQKQGSLQPNLVYRLDVIHIEIPPLRERRSDVLFLANLFLQEFNAKYQKQLSGFSLPVRKRLIDYTWPGNVRELRNAVEEAVILTQGKTVRDVNLAKDL